MGRSRMGAEAEESWVEVDWQTRVKVVFRMRKRAPEVLEVAE